MAGGTTRVLFFPCEFALLYYLFYLTGVINMKKQNGFTLIELIIVLVIVTGFGSWIWNAVQLASCDFESNYKCEAIHGIGLVVPPTSIITIWFGDDSV